MVARSRCIRSYTLLGDQISRLLLNRTRSAPPHFRVSLFFLAALLLARFGMAFFLGTLFFFPPISSKRSAKSKPNRSLILVLSAGITIVFPTVESSLAIVSAKAAPVIGSLHLSCACERNQWCTRGRIPPRGRRDSRPSAPFEIVHGNQALR